MILRLIAFLALLTVFADAVEVRTEQAQHDIAVLTEQKIISSPAYWSEHVVTGGKCDGAKVSALLMHAAGLFRKAANREDAIAVLQERGIIGAPEYWLQNTAPGKACDGGNVAAVLNRMVARLPSKRVPPLTAIPLEAVPAKQLRESYDIIIAGAGTGGTGAAIQAARMGRSVLLLDETDYIGGQMNAAGVTSMDEGVTLVRERGLYRELSGQIAAHYQPLNITSETAYWMRHVCVEPRVGRHLLHMFLADAKGKGTLDLALRTVVSKVIKNGDTVTGIEITATTPTGTETRQIDCQVLVDATEWGDVIPLTGARYRVGNCTNDSIDPKRAIQDATWTAVVKQYPQGVPSGFLITQAPPGYTENVHKAFTKSLVEGDKVDTKVKPWDFATFIGYRGMPDSSRSGDAPPITRTHLNYNNDFHITIGEVESPALRQRAARAMRLKTLHLVYYIQNTLGKKDWAVADDEGYDTPYNRAAIDAWLSDSPELAPYREILYHFSTMAYARESRRIIGLHTLTASEIDRRPEHTPTTFPNTVAIGDYAVDLHGSMAPKYLEMDLDHEADIPDKFGGHGLGPFGIPFECFIPEKIDGFLPAEKNISQSRMANGATRLQPSTLLMGQAAGTIAALAVQKHIPPRQVDPVQVQDVLLDAGDTLFTKTVIDIPRSSPDWKAVQFVLTRGLMQLDERKFNPQDEVSAAEFAAMVKELPAAQNPPSIEATVTRVEAARKLSTWVHEGLLK
ncbi:MAG: hypothetical protein JWO08_111 [Verrucomicrobiaceae bacterium]|nr:hypothetical protein [Verrucomicrobiaceae bacterium]